MCSLIMTPWHQVNGFPVLNPPCLSTPLTQSIVVYQVPPRDHVLLAQYNFICDLFNLADLLASERFLFGRHSNILEFKFIHTWPTQSTKCVSCPFVPSVWGRFESDNYVIYSALFFISFTNAFMFFFQKTTKLLLISGQVYPSLIWLAVRAKVLEHFIRGYSLRVVMRVTNRQPLSLPRLTKSSTVQILLCLNRMMRNQWCRQRAATPVCITGSG